MKTATELEQALAEAGAARAAALDAEDEAYKPYQQARSARMKADEQFRAVEEEVALRKRWDALPEDRRLTLTSSLGFSEPCEIITSGPRRATVRSIRKGRYGPASTYTLPSASMKVAPEDAHKLSCLRSKEPT